MVRSGVHRTVMVFPSASYSSLPSSEVPGGASFAIAFKASLTPLASRSPTFAKSTGGRGPERDGFRDEDGEDSDGAEAGDGGRERMVMSAMEDRRTMRKAGEDELLRTRQPMAASYAHRIPSTLLLLLLLLLPDVFWLVRLSWISAPRTSRKLRPPALPLPPLDPCCCCWC